ncbi:MAG: hypothetical protein GY853_13500 [PVC group bacterium]|nr:hypothetical protein [PVC group bacterium]
MSVLLGGCTYTVREFAHGDDNETFRLKSRWTRVSYEGKNRTINMHAPANPGGIVDSFWKLLDRAAYPIGQMAGKPEYNEETRLGE